MMGWMQDIVGLQREIYLAFAHQIQAIARGGGWASSWSICPWESCSVPPMR